MKSAPAWALALLCIAFSSCQNRNDGAPELVKSINLKRGEIISCGPASLELGSLTFDVSSNKDIANELNLAVKLLHSFEYDEAEKAFAKIIDKEPEAAIAYWGVAMSNFHPLWAAPMPEELEKGAQAIQIAKEIKDKSEKESDYIEALGAFYADKDKLDHMTRTRNFESAMEALYKKYPNDNNIAAFYALSLTAAADPTDKTYTRQKKAGQILVSLFPGQPDHPGITHYIIHAYDYPELASLALPAAKKYASIAPSSAHAVHMPSHIFTRLGLWDDCIQSNLTSVTNAKCYAEQSGIDGHWDEEVHALDYLVYAYLQKGNNTEANKLWEYAKSMKTVSPMNFKVAYSFSAIPSRLLLENRKWEEAASFTSHHQAVPWKEYPWQQSTIHFTRLMGLVHTGKVDQARNDLKELRSIFDRLKQEKNTYQASKVEILAYAGEGWIKWKENNHDEAVRLLKLAADLEDKTGKHPVTPGEVIPAREMLGDLYMAIGKADAALVEYEACLSKFPNRFNGLYGAAHAAAVSGDKAKARQYFQKLLDVTSGTTQERKELSEAKAYLES